MLSFVLPESNIKQSYYNFSIQQTSCVTVFSLLSVWYLLNLLGVYWCNNWCPLPHYSTPLWSFPVPPHNEYTCIPYYRTNWHAGRKANQIVWQQLGEEIAFPLSGRKASMLSLSLGFCWRGEGANGEKKGKLLGCSLTQVKSRPFPSIFAFASLSFHFSPHSFWQCRSVTQRHRGLHSSISSSSNNYGDRVALAAKLGPLRSQQHIVQPD